MAWQNGLYFLVGTVLIGVGAALALRPAYGLVALGVLFIYVAQFGEFDD